MANKVAAASARFIKLGPSGKWAGECLADGTLRLGYYEVPHALGLAGDAEGIRKAYMDAGLKRGPSSSHATQVLHFYDRDPKALWITFAHGDLWWCFAEPDVEFLTTDKTTGTASRLRRTVNGWSNHSLGGRRLRMNGLIGALTKVTRFQGTICNIGPDELASLLRLLNDDENPKLKAASTARVALLEAIGGLMRDLRPKEFELLVDLAYSQSGWRRRGVVGGTQEATDIDLELPSTGETALVQVKTATSQAELEDYIARFGARGEDRMFYVYHTARKPLATDHPRVTLVDQQRLAEMVLNAGLFDWLMRKAA
jgi:hypothetical protein